MHSPIRPSRFPLISRAALQRSTSAKKPIDWMLKQVVTGLLVSSLLLLFNCETRLSTVEIKPAASISPNFNFIATAPDTVDGNHPFPVEFYLRQAATSTPVNVTYSLSFALSTGTGELRITSDTLLPGDTGTLTYSLFNQYRYSTSFVPQRQHQNLTITYTVNDDIHSKTSTSTVYVR